MSWLDATEIRGKFSIQSNKYDSQIGYASASAALVLNNSLSDEIYNEAAAEAPNPVTNRYSRVVEAHSYLTMWFFVGNVGNKLGDVGFIKSAQDSASPASQRVVTNNYLTPKEIREMRAEFLEMAKLHLSPYGTISIDPESTPTINSYPAVAVRIRPDW